ncbi:hypothetical protein LV83_03709 [Algoriphagus yeomjeoni]|uniref:Glycosyl hydrolase family 32 n=2 Tax=Algoriphagus yeomjeoni TaxID=291403 RepID=A0A327P060_9BACT|nr:hypothetical protein LV83_03709 [Algoriphagus yeomjeoni]
MPRWASCYSSKDFYNWKNEGVVLDLYMGDRWNGQGKLESEYVFLPITITEEGEMEIHWYNEWDLSMFTPEKKQ